LVKEVCLNIINEVIKENDIVSVIAFYYGNDLVVKHKYILNANDCKEVIYVIERLTPRERGKYFYETRFGGRIVSVKIFS
jgi:hypothetical protein